MSKKPGMRCPTFPMCGPPPDGSLLISINGTSMSNETSLPDNEELELWIRVISNFVSPVIYVIAIVGNCLGLGVVWKAGQTKKLSTYTYLLSLILSDVMYLVVNAGRLARSLSDKSGFASSPIRTTLLYFNNVFSQTSIAIVIVMCIERLIVLIKPLKARSMLFSRHPLKIIGVCFFINILTPLMRSIVPKNPDSYMSAKNSTTESGSSMDRTISIILLLNESIINFFFPVIFLIFTSTAISLAYCRIVKKQRTVFKMQRSNVSDNQNKATLTVFIIAAMYLLSLIPSLVGKILENIGDEYSKFGIYRNVNKTITSVAYLMSLINAANDFIIFILVSNNTRQLFKDMYCKRLLRSSAAIETTVPVTNNKICLTNERDEIMKMKSSAFITTVSDGNISRSE